jgi:hypothetical protein
MDLTTWMATVEADINRRTGTADRTWAWAYLIHAIARHDLLTAPPGTTTDAVWVEPQMAWALDDLVDAGVRTPPPTVPAVAAADVRAVLTAALRRLILVASADDPRLPMPLVDACGYAARRAAVAHHAYAGTLP